MAVKFLTTKKHDKTAKLIKQNKIVNYTIEFEISDPKDMADKPLGETISTIEETEIAGIKPQPKMVALKERKPVKERKIKDTVTKSQYNEAVKIIKQYYNQMALDEIKSYEELINYKFNHSEKNKINLSKEISARVANNLEIYFKTKGIEINPQSFSIRLFKKINFKELEKQRNFGFKCLTDLKNYLHIQD
jgi:hypothetical protein